MDLIQAFQSSTEQLVSKSLDWLVEAVPNLVAALVILIIGYAVAVWASRATYAVVKRHERFDPMLASVASSLIRYALMIIVVIATLGQLGFHTTSLIAALGAAGLAICLALQGTLANIAAGFMLLWLRPFRSGDYIETDSVAGTVNEVSLFATELQTWDGIYKFVPNSELWNKTIANYSRFETRLVDLKFSIAYGDDIQRGRDTLLEIAKADDRVLAEPEPPLTFVDNLDDSAVVLALRLWTSTANYWSVRRDLTELGKVRLEAAGLTIPFPQLDIHTNSTSQLKQNIPPWN